MVSKFTYSHNYRCALLTILLLLTLSPSLSAQADRKLIREGNREYSRGNFPESEIAYRKALDKNSQSADAVFNTGDALYRQKKYEEAGIQFMENHDMNDDKRKKSASLYNLGNSFLMANKIKESIDAYKGALKLDPDNMEAKYNLAYAQDMLKKQEEQQQQQEQQQKQDNQDKNGQDKEQQNSDKTKDQPDQNQEQQQEQKQQGMSKEDAERLLNALAGDEKKIQEKVKLAKARNARVRTTKNW